jgi:hypothetical protein
MGSDSIIEEFTATARPGGQGARESALGALMPMSPNESKPIVEMRGGGDAIQSSLF